MMQTLKILFLSVLYGITSILPASSLGHLSLFKEVLGLNEKNFNYGFYYSVFSIGAALAMYIYYFKVHTKITRSLFKKKKNLSGEADIAYRKAGRNLFLSLIPVLVLFIPVGKDTFVLSLGKYFMTDDSLVFVGIASIFCAVLMFISLWYLKSEYTEKVNLLSAKNAVFFGIFQIPAYIFPGLSHISVGASRTSVSDIDIKNVLKETYLYLAPAFLVTGIVRTVYCYDSGKGVDLTAAIIGFAISFVLSLLMLAFVNRFFTKRVYKAFTIYTLIFGVIITGTSLFRMYFI